MTDAQNPSTGKAEIGSAPERKLICVIDDDVAVLKSLRFLLETEGFAVRTFHTGSALLGSRARQQADCLIVDYKMAGIDGLELARRLRDLDIRTPIVLITGYADDSLSTKANSAGVRQVLRKPDLDGLVASVRNATNPSSPAD
jgi:FixJ family two-component response regulator